MVQTDEVVWMLFQVMSEKMWRLRYARERACPEWFDLGGEA